MDRTLKFGADGCFKIVQFTDVHWMNDSEEDRRTSAVERMVLKEERPDLVVFTGDTSVGTDNLVALRKALEPVEEAQVPFAVVFGNHDDEHGESKEALLAVQQESDLCLTQAGDPGISGLGNYILEIGSRNGDRTGWILYMMDSGTYSRNEKVGGYGYFERDQINWYVNSSKEIKNKYGNVPALAFFHIPLPEYNEVWESQTCYGEKNEGVCCPKQNSGMFSAMLEMGDVKGMFVGHDHINDYYGDLYGIRLYYGRATGYHTYGKENFARGARIIRLREGQSEVESWLRLEDGTVLRNQPMHRPESPES